MARFGPDASACVPVATNSGGQYWVVTGGTMTLNDKSYGHLSCLFVTSDESPTIIGAGAEGMEMLVLQFPERTLVGMAAE